MKFLDLDYFIRRSKVILNLHAFEPWNRQEQPRIFYALINGKYVLSEVSQINYFGDYIQQFSLPKDLVSKSVNIISKGKYRELGERAREWFKATTFSDDAFKEYILRCQQLRAGLTHGAP
jgi:hypothetical protein